ncbi:MAG: DegV family protein [Desulfobacterales bacterium]
MTSLPLEKGENCLSVHLHSAEKEKIRQQFQSIGHILQWSDEDMAVQSEKTETVHHCIRVMTDAAGSVTRTDAQELGITLLDSYILMEDRALPESLFNPDDLYKAMREEKKVSTSQASVFERYQQYQSAVSQYEKVLYLCVGSVFTGNWQTAAAWKEKNDPENRMILVDTGAASGRLGIMALAAARYAARAETPEAVIAYAEKIIDRCEDFVFIDRLHYLAAGGRLSKTGAFFGDMLHMKPIISPQPDGARKVGMVRNRDAQTGFALTQLKRAAEQNPCLLILLEYTDNREWVQEEVQKKIRENCPEAEILVRPLSLTSGVHMGPGTWGIAFVPK